MHASEVFRPEKALPADNQLRLVKPVFVSVDPARDSVDQIRHYAKGEFNFCVIDPHLFRMQISTPGLLHSLAHILQSNRCARHTVFISRVRRPKRANQLVSVMFYGSLLPLLQRKGISGV